VVFAARRASGALEYGKNLPLPQKKGLGAMRLLEIPVQPDFEAFAREVIRREAPPRRVYYSELYADPEILDAVIARFGLDEKIDRADPHSALRRLIAAHRFLGYDMFRVKLTGFDFELHWDQAADTTAIEGQRRGGREWVDEHKGPIQTWEDFERYPWPDPRRLDLRPLEWFEKNLPEDMRVYELTTHVFEHLSWSLGYESFCYAALEEPELVEAIATKIGELSLEHVRILCQFQCVGVIWASDDMGFKTAPLLSPELLRRWVLPWHKKSAEIAHAHGKPYFLHACGNLEALMDDLIDDVKVDAKHSFEDAIVPIAESWRRYGSRVALLGGLDMDTLCRADPATIRRKTREILDACHGPSGGYALGTGNSVANYLPLENYLAMLDEGRRYSAGC